MPKVKLRESDFEEQFSSIIKLAKKGLRAVIEQAGPSPYYLLPADGFSVPATISLYDVRSVLDGKKQQRKNHVRAIRQMLNNHETVGLADGAGNVIAIVTNIKPDPKIEQAARPVALVGGAAVPEQKPAVIPQKEKPISAGGLRDHWGKNREKIERGAVLLVEAGKMKTCFTIRAYDRTMEIGAWLPHTRIGKKDFVGLLKDGKRIGIKDGKVNAGVAELAPLEA